MVKITYNLSDKGQKASILAGGDGQRKQVLTVGREEPDFPRALAEASVDGNGKASLITTDYSDGLSPPTREWDHLPTAGEILDDYQSRRAARIAEIEEEEQDRRNEALRVIEERRTRTDSAVACESPYAYYEAIVPDWDYNAPADVKTSPEAVRWLDELDAENRRRKAAKADEVARIRREKEEEKRRIAETESRRRERLGIGDGEHDLTIQEGCLSEVPIWTSHKRGKNWASTITSNPRAPGGLERDFWEKAKGDYYYMVPVSLQPGTAVEFGADYYSGSGAKDPRRWYGYVVRITEASDEHPAMLIVKKCSTGKDAIVSGEKFAATREMPT